MMLAAKKREMGITEDDPEFVNPDGMSYEQLLELENKIGCVSKGFNKEEMQVCLTKIIFFLIENPRSGV